MCTGELPRLPVRSCCSTAGAELGAASGAIAVGKPGATVSGIGWVAAGRKHASISELDVSPSSENVVSGSGDVLAASLGRKDEKMSRMALPNDNLFFSKDGFRV